MTCDLVAVGGDVDRAGREVARDVGQQASEDEHRAGLGDLGGHRDPGRDLVVERREGQRALLAGLDEDTREHRDRRPVRQSASGPRHRLGEDIAFHPKLHRLTALSRSARAWCSQSCVIAD